MSGFFHRGRYYEHVGTGETDVESLDSWVRDQRDRIERGNSDAFISLAEHFRQKSNYVAYLGVLQEAAVKGHTESTATLIHFLLVLHVLERHSPLYRTVEPCLKQLVALLSVLSLPAQSSECLEFIRDLRRIEFSKAYVAEPWRKKESLSRLREYRNGYSELFVWWAAIESSWVSSLVRELRESELDGRMGNHLSNLSATWVSDWLYLLSGEPERNVSLQTDLDESIGILDQYLISTLREEIFLYQAECTAYIRAARSNLYGLKKEGVGGDRIEDLSNRFTRGVSENRADVEKMISSAQVLFSVDALRLMEPTIKADLTLEACVLNLTRALARGSSINALGSLKLMRCETMLLAESIFEELL